MMNDTILDHGKKNQIFKTSDLLMVQYMIANGY